MFFSMIQVPDLARWATSDGASRNRRRPGPAPHGPRAPSLVWIFTRSITPLRFIASASRSNRGHPDHGPLLLHHPHLSPRSGPSSLSTAVNPPELFPCLVPAAPLSLTAHSVRLRSGLRCRVHRRVGRSRRTPQVFTSSENGRQCRGSIWTSHARLSPHHVAPIYWLKLPRYAKSLDSGKGHVIASQPN